MFLSSGIGDYMGNNKCYKSSVPIKTKVNLFGWVRYFETKTAGLEKKDLQLPLFKIPFGELCLLATNYFKKMKAVNMS